MILTIPARQLWRAALLTWIAASAPLVAQPVAQQPPAGKPVTFDGIRAQDRLAPTPQYRQLATGVYGRQIVEAASRGGDYTVQVWSLLVSPKTTTADATLPGAAVVTVIAGRVDLIAGGKTTRLDPGAAASVAEGAAMRFVNADEKRPAQLRAVVLSGNP
jgi:quercetin dioxygenase-like cupin family protein